MLGNVCKLYYSVGSSGAFRGWLKCVAVPELHMVQMHVVERLANKPVHLLHPAFTGMLTLSHYHNLSVLVPLQLTALYHCRQGSLSCPHDPAITRFERSEHSFGLAL